jgi:hypothetical protein
MSKTVKNCEVKLPNSSVPHPPLPPKSVMDWYANALVTALDIPIEKIKANFNRHIASLNNPPAETPSANVPNARPPTKEEMEIAFKQNELAEQAAFLEQQAALNRQAREIALLDQATKMSEAQTRRNMESCDRINGTGYERRYF